MVISNLSLVRNLSLAILLSLSDGASASSCPTPHELLADLEISVGTHCDATVQAYKMGFETEPRPELSAQETRDDLDYYFTTRTYLLLKNRARLSPEDDPFGFLLSQYHLFDQNSDNGKVPIYGAFLMAEYAQQTGELGISTSYLMSSISYILKDTPISAISELICFIELDHPELAVGDIFKSEAFSACVTAK